MIIALSWTVAVTARLLHRSRPRFRTLGSLLLCPRFVLLPSWDFIVVFIDMIMKTVYSFSYRVFAFGSFAEQYKASSTTLLELPAIASNPVLIASYTSHFH